MKDLLFEVSTLRKKHNDVWVCLGLSDNLFAFRACRCLGWVRVRLFMTWVSKMDYLPPITWVIKQPNW